MRKQKDFSQQNGNRGSRGKNLPVSVASADKKFSITKVYTKNIIIDSFQRIRNIFGLRLRGYEKMINRATDALLEEANTKYPKIKWWRLTINPLTKGSVMLTIYGEHE
jgi:hypothetical protein